MMTLLLIIGLVVCVIGFVAYSPNEVDGEDDDYRMLYNEADNILNNNKRG